MPVKSYAAVAAISLALVGCGSGSSGSGVNGYSLNDYDSLPVNQDTLAGTWVAVGSGEYSASWENFSDNETLAVKEYFVITGDPEAGFEKHSCHGNYTESVSITDNQVTFGLFEGLLTEDGAISGQYLEDLDDESTSLDLRMIKVSNETNAIGTLSQNFVAEEPEELPIYCFQQSNGKGSYDNEDGDHSYTSEYYYLNQMEIYSYTDSELNVNFFLYDSFKYFSTYDGTASFEVISRTEFSESINFNASDDMDSVTGMISVQIPTQ